MLNIILHNLFSVPMPVVVLRVFLFHLFIVLLMCMFLVFDKHFTPPPYESPLLWAAFMLIDFPASIVVFITSGRYGVVGIPQFFCDYFDSHWLIIHVIWPAAVFQLVGTVNWTVLIWILRIVMK